MPPPRMKLSEEANVITNDCWTLSVVTARNIQNYWVKVDVKGPDECWLWTANTVRGYGQFGVGPGLKRRHVGAHRVAYFLGHGVDPGALCVCHTCDQPLCQNPAHLWLGTNLDNMQDCVAKGAAPPGMPTTSGNIRSL
jgi:hypothetical protein